MSMHTSLKMSKGGTKNRSVLSRAERVAIMLKDGRLKPGDKVLGLAKVRVEKTMKKGKGAKKKEEGDKAATPAAAAPAAAAKPAAKPAAGAKK